MKKIVLLFVCLFVFSPIYTKAYFVDEKEVKVAIIDTGIDDSSEILKPHIQQMLTIHPNSNSLDENGHGTKIAHLIVQHMPTNIKLVAIKALDETGKATASDIAAGIHVAIEQRVHIINLSVAMLIDDEQLQAAIQEANKQGIIVIASVGNFGGSKVLYPAKYENVIGVGAINRDGQLSTFSQRGKEVDFVALGEAVEVIGLQNKATLENGTSLSTAQITRAAAALMSNGIEGDALRQALQSAAHLPMHTENVGFGYITESHLNYEIIQYRLNNDTISKKKELIIEDADKEWILTFSKKLAHVSEQSIVLIGEHEVIPIKLIAKGNKVIVKPQSRYKKDVKYSLIISKELTSANGEKLKSSLIQPFTLK